MREREPKSGMAEPSTDNAADERKEQALRQELAYDAGSGGTEGEPDAELALAALSPGEHQAGDVAASDQQHEAHRREKCGRPQTVVSE